MDERRVNISYSLKISDLEDEVQALLFRCFGKLKKLESKMDGKLYKEALSLATFSKISEIRESLSEADFMLDDISKIIIGFENFKNNDVPPTIEKDRQEVDQLKQKIEEFKELTNEKE
jgi:hypothetical protein